MALEIITALENACVVVAHPDDEALWFSSALSPARRIVICFLGNPAKLSRGSDREGALARHPLADKIECLGLDVPVGAQACDWQDPVEVEAGLQLQRGMLSYIQAFKVLCEKLEPILRPYDHVLTHNPWGEYGHELHVLVHKAVVAATDSPIWFSNYVSRRSEALMRRHLFEFREVVALPTNVELAHTIRDLYIEEECWTAALDNEWPRVEHFARLDREGLPLSWVTWPRFEVEGQ